MINHAGIMFVEVTERGPHAMVLCPRPLRMNCVGSGHWDTHTFPAFAPVGSYGKTDDMAPARLDIDTPAISGPTLPQEQQYVGNVRGFGPHVRCGKHRP